MISREQLRVQVRALPTYSEDGLWVKTQVLRLLGEAVTAVSASGEGLKGSSPTSPAAPTAALNRAEVKV